MIDKISNWLFGFRYWIETNGSQYRVMKRNIFVIEEVWFKYDKETDVYSETNYDYGVVKTFQSQDEALKALHNLKWKRVGTTWHLTIR